MSRIVYSRERDDSDQRVRFYISQSQIHKYYKHKDLRPSQQEPVIYITFDKVTFYHMVKDFLREYELNLNSEDINRCELVEKVTELEDMYWSFPFEDFRALIKENHLLRMKHGIEEGCTEATEEEAEWGD